MGQIIEKLALDRGHSIVGKYNSSNPFTKDHVISADVAIEFSSPALATNHLKLCFEHQIPVVTGTTGWYNDYESVKEVCQQKSGALFTATNFSLGVNLYFEMSKRLTRLMNQQPYRVSIEEIHHTEKKDAPSGTAITLAETVIAASDSLKNWHLREEATEPIQANNGELEITAKRLPGVPGTHILTFDSDVDCIRLEHEAKNRLGFATGAILAAEWICGKQGVFGMSDLLNFED